MDIKDILEEISLPARSNKRGFKETDKLEQIEEILKREGSPFHLIKKSDHAWIFGQKPIRYDEETVLVSSHADIVPEIKKPFSELNEETKYFKGTYDNMGTNGACVELMVNRELPDNLYFAFTAEEESGRMTGAEYALNYMINKSGQSPKVIVLDVTYEGYNHDRLCTIEGLHAPSEEERRALLQSLLTIEGQEQSFEVVRMKKKDDNSFLPESYQAKGTTDCDESYFYAKQNCTSFSLDLPTTGSMHSDSGLRTKQAVMWGYLDSLAAVCYLLTRSYPEKIEALKTDRDAAVLAARDTEFYEKITSSSYGYYGYYGWDCDYDLSAHPEYAKKQKEEIPGQMSFSDFMDMGDKKHNTPSRLDDRLEEDQDFHEWYEQLMNYAYESASMYSREQYLMYLNDIAYYIGISLDDLEPELEEHLCMIFNDAWDDLESEGFYYEEDYDS